MKVILEAELVEDWQVLAGYDLFFGCFEQSFFGSSVKRKNILQKNQDLPDE